MTKKQKVEKSEIMKYWETRLPQVWYSDKNEGSIEWLNELEYKRYRVFYSCLPEVAEFEWHKGEKVLEVGVGVGTDLIQYAKNGARVSGIDLTEKAMESTKKYFELRNLPYETLQTADAENLPFENDTFELVYSFGVLHHTPNTDKAIKEIHRILKPEGKAIVMLYARGWKHYFKRVFIHGILMGRLFRDGYDRLISKQTEVHGNSPLSYVYKKKEIQDFFRIFGEVEITKRRMGEYFDYAPYKTKKFPQVIKNLCDLLTLERAFGENWIIKAVKTPEKPKFSFWKTLLKP